MVYFLTMIEWHSVTMLFVINDIKRIFICGVVYADLKLTIEVISEVVAETHGKYLPGISLIPVFGFLEPIWVLVGS